MPPRVVEPEGRRYTITGQHVAYMKWDFIYRVKPSTGLQLFNIRFDGTRIAYEISLQQIAMIYSGSNPIQMMASYFQVSELIGLNSFELVPGYDCPDHATFLNVTQYSNGRPVLYKNVVCIFEQSSGTPIRRHYANNQKDGFSHYAGAMDYYLVVRTVTTIFVSDYILDYIFHRNGVIEIKHYLTGCLKTSTFDQNELFYGNEIMPNVLSTIYNYLVNFKIDIDILGIDNSVNTTNIYGHVDRNPFADDKDIFLRSQARMRSTRLETEKQAAFPFENFPDYVIIYSNKTTKMNKPRGYRLKIGSSSPLKLVDDLPIADSAENGATWARYRLAITRYNRTEDSSATIYSGANPHRPLIDFQDFLANDESIVDQVIV